MAGPQPEADGIIKLNAEHPFLADIRSETIKIEDKNQETPPALELSLSVEADPSVNSVFEIEKTSVQHILKLGSDVKGLLCVQNGKLSCLKPESTGLLVSTPEKTFDIFSLSGQTDALLVADSTSGWSLEPVSTCNTVS